MNMEYGNMENSSLAQLAVCSDHRNLAEGATEPVTKCKVKYSINILKLHNSHKL